MEGCNYFVLLNLAESLQKMLTPRVVQIHREAKTAKTMLLILGVHMLSLIPYLIVVVWRYFVEEGGMASALSVAKKVCTRRTSRLL